MKRLLILLAIIPIFGFSQISESKEINIKEIGKYRSAYSELAILERWDSNDIVFRYKNKKYQHITDYESFRFKDVDNALDYLYNTLITGVTSVYDDEKTLQLPDKTIYIDFRGEPLNKVANIKVQDKNLPSKIDEVYPLKFSNINELFGKANMEQPIIKQETKWTVFTNSFKNTVRFRVFNYNSTNYLHLKLTIIKGGLSAINFKVFKDQEVTFILEDGSVLKLKNINNAESCYGCGATGLSGSAADGANIIYALNNEELNQLKNKKIISYKIENNDSLIENELKPKKQEEFRKNLQSILD